MKPKEPADSNAEPRPRLLLESHESAKGENQQESWRENEAQLLRGMEGAEMLESERAFELSSTRASVDTGHEDFLWRNRWWFVAAFVLSAISWRAAMMLTEHTAAHIVTRVCLMITLLLCALPMWRRFNLRVLYELLHWPRCAYFVCVFVCTCTNTHARTHARACMHAESRPLVL